MISFNWDTLLEESFRKRYGRQLKVGGPELYKPHGDVGSPDNNWILPHEGGYLPQDLLDYINSLVEERPKNAPPCRLFRK